MPRDFRRGQATAFITNGCSNHSDKDRQVSDYYASPIEATEKLLEVEKFSREIYEPFVGGGHIAKVFQDLGYEVEGADIEYRGWEGTKIIDFFTEEEKPVNADIVTNPPYKFVEECWSGCCRRITEGHKVAMLLKLTFLEGQSRKKMFELYPPTRIHVFSKRICPAMNGEFDKYKTSAIAYAWFVYDKQFKGKPTVDWI